MTTGNYCHDCFFCGGGGGLVFGGGTFLVGGGSVCDNMGGVSTDDEVMLTSPPDLAHCGGGVAVCNWQSPTITVNSWQLASVTVCSCQTGDYQQLAIVPLFVACDLVLEVESLGVEYLGVRAVRTLVGSEPRHGEVWKAESCSGNITLQGLEDTELRALKIARPIPWVQ